MRIILKPMGLVLLVGALVGLMSLVLVYRGQAARVADAPAEPGSPPPSSARQPPAATSPARSSSSDTLRTAPEEAALRARMVDRYLPSVPEKETFRDFQGASTGTAAAGVHAYRHASHSGWFSFTMRVDPEAPNDLLLTYWGSDNGSGGARAFDILIDGHKIASETLDSRRPERFVDIPYPIPAALTKGRSQVRVELKSTGAFAGGIWDCWTLRGEA